MNQVSWVRDGRLFIISTPNEQTAMELYHTLPANCAPRWWRIVNKRAMLLA
jgi:hypothetical protein